MDWSWLAGVGLATTAQPAGRKKTRGRRLAEHPVRKKILEAIRGLSGINETRLGAVAGLARGTLRHHLKLLERGGAIRTVRLGREKHFLLSEDDPSRAETIARIRHGRAIEVLRQILLEPGLPQKSLAQRCQMTRDVLRKYLNLLKEGNIIREQAAGRTRRYYPGPQADASTCNLLGLARPRFDTVPPRGYLPLPDGRLFL